MFCIGILYYLISNEFITIRSPFSFTHLTATDKNQINIIKKKTSLYFWHNEKWQHEDIDLIWPEEVSPQLTYLINSWLALITEEEINQRYIVLQSITLNEQLEAYISFNRNPFNKAMATFEKWLWIEGLMKTIRENGISLQGLYFLVHHKPLIDPHLDFTNAWPLTGFLPSTNQESI